MHLVAATELGVAELLGDPQRGDVVRAQLEARALQIEVVEEVAVQRERRVPAVAFAPLLGIEDEVLQIRGRWTLEATETRSRESDQPPVGLDRPEHDALLLRLLFEPLFPRRRHRWLVPHPGRASHAQIGHPPRIRREVVLDRRAKRGPLASDDPAQCHGR